MEGFRSSSGSASIPLKTRVCKRSKVATKKQEIEKKLGDSYEEKLQKELPKRKKYNKKK